MGIFCNESAFQIASVATFAKVEAELALFDIAKLLIFIFLL